MRRVSLLAALAVVVTACAIPERTNPADPAGAPIAKLSIHVRGPDGIVVNSAEGGRASTFILDASESTDPSNRGPLHYFFETDDPAAGDAGNANDFDEALTPLGTTTSYETALTLTSAMLPDRVGVATRTVKVKVVAGGGHFAIATASVVLRNRAPAVDASGDLFVSKSRTVPVILDACGGAALAQCSSRDPDGDPLTFTWEQVGGAPPVALAALDAAQQRMMFTSVATPGIATRGTTFRVRANDGLAESAGYVSVYPSEQVWIGTKQPNRVYRFFPEFSVRDAWVDAGGATAPFVQATAIAAAVNGDVWIGGGYPEPTIVRRLSRSLREIRSWNVPSTGGSLVSLADQGSQGCAGFTTVVGMAPVPAFARLLTNSTVVVTQPPAGAGYLRSRVFPVTPDGSAGPCWAVNDDFVGQIALNGALTAVPVTGAVFHTALAVTQTPDGALWLSDYFQNLTPALIRIPPGGGPATSIAVPPGTAFLLDRIFPDVDGTSVLAWNEFDRRTYRLEAGGVSAVTDLPPLLLAGASADAAGSAIWLLDGDREELRRFVFREGAFREAGTVPLQEVNSDNAPFGMLAVDASTGDLLATVGTPSATSPLKALARIPPWLERSRQVPFAAGQSFGLSGDPSSGHLWYSASGGQIRNLRLDGAELYAPDPTAPHDSAAAIPGGEAWTLVFAGSPTLQRIDALGASLESVALSSSTLGPVAASPDFDTICVGKYSGASYRWHASAGTLETLADPAADPHRQTLAGPDGSCWFLGDAVNTSTTPLLKIPAGSASPTIDVTAIASVPIQNEAWLALDPRDSTAWLADTGNARVLHLNAAGAVTSTFGFNAEVLALLPRCASTADPACVEVWRTKGLQVLRSGADLTLPPTETLSITAGTPIAIDVVP